MLIQLNRDIFVFEYLIKLGHSKGILSKIKKNEIVLVIQHSKLNSLYYRYLILFNDKFYELTCDINFKLH